MIQIKPNWYIAQQISKRHTIISVGISISLFLGLTLLAIIILKCLGVPNSGIVLKTFVDQHKAIIYPTAFFIHFVPINYYAIIKVFQTPYQRFDLKIIAKETPAEKLDDKRDLSR